jgi:hypothetical protein
MSGRHFDPIEVSFSQAETIEQSDERRFGQTSQELTRQDHEALTPIVSFGPGHVVLFFGESKLADLVSGFSKSDLNAIVTELGRQFAVSYHSRLVELTKGAGGLRIPPPQAPVPHPVGGQPLAGKTFSRRGVYDIWKFTPRSKRLLTFTSKRTRP